MSLGLVWRVDDRLTVPSHVGLVLRCLEKLLRHVAVVWAKEWRHAIGWHGRDDTELLCSVLKVRRNLVRGDWDIW